MKFDNLEQLKKLVVNDTLTIAGNIECNFDINLPNVDIDCWNINCGDIKCMDINCWDINCWDINCGDINCRDIDYYAIAIAYNSFTCKSVKGRRENAKHICLDSKIKYKK